MNPETRTAPPDLQDIYKRGADVIPLEYLLCNQPEPERAAKIIAQAEARRQRRNAKRLSTKGTK